METDQLNLWGYFKQNWARRIFPQGVLRFYFSEERVKTEGKTVIKVSYRWINENDEKTGINLL